MQSEQLNEILNQLDHPEANKQTLGYEALAIIDNILESDPMDLNARVLRMRLNTDWVFANTSAIIDDAEFIIRQDDFEIDKMVGYDWLVWVYDEAMSLPEKAMETLEEQLIEAQSIKKKYKKDETEAMLLDKLAFIKHNNNQTDEAMSLWEKSFEKDPYLSGRNAFVGLLFLDQEKWDLATKFLLKHYDWSYQTEDGFRLKYGVKLKELFKEKKLDNQPDLIGLLFNIIRNEEDYFKLEGKLDYFEKYMPALEIWAEKFPKNSFILTAIAHTYFFDLKNYEKAHEAFVKMFDCDRGIHFTSMARIHKAAKKSGNDFFELPFRFEGISSDMYNIMTDLSNYTDKAKKKKKKKKYALLAIKYGEVGYSQYKDYIINGKGSSENNEPHMFAMLCNNYANALGRYADLYFKKEEKWAFYKQAGAIHMEGYNISPFIENLENASRDYFKGKDYQNSIKYSLEAMKVYKEDLSIYDFQFHYWQIVRSYIALKDLANAEVYYFKAKELLTKVGKGSKDANYKFIFIAKLFFEFAVDKQKEYQKYIPEMEWFLEKEFALKQEHKEHGLVSYYLGVCYKENNQKEKAINAFQVTVDHLQDANWGFYDDKCEAAEEFINELGGKAIKKKSKSKKKGPLKRLWRAITFPILFIALLGGIIYAAATEKSKGEKKRKG